MLQKITSKAMLLFLTGFFILLISTVTARGFSDKFLEADPIMRTVQKSSATIVFAIDNEGELFVNGVSHWKVNDWDDVKTVEVDLADGDTISIKASDHGLWYGVIADLYYKGKHYHTGQQHWKAVKEFDLFGREDKNAWMHSSYSTCAWPKAEILPRANQMFSGKAKDFPYKATGAQYVWAVNADENDKIFLRLTVGGEKCGESIQGNSGTVGAASSSASGTSTGGTLNGQADTSSTLECQCKVAEGPVAKCWEWGPEGRPRCQERDCNPKFECVPDGAPGATMVCMRRMATEKIVRGDRDGYCTTTDVAVEFQVPYAGIEP